MRYSNAALLCCPAEKIFNDLMTRVISLLANEHALTAYSNVLKEVCPAPSRNRCICVSIVRAGVVSG